MKYSELYLKHVRTDRGGLFPCINLPAALIEKNPQEECNLHCKLCFLMFKLNLLHSYTEKKQKFIHFLISSPHIVTFLGSIVLFAKTKAESIGIHNAGGLRS